MVGFMRAVDVKSGTGPASAMFINTGVPRPVLGPGEEALVRVRAFGVNRGDILQREGKYPGISHLTRIMGLEFSGIIEELWQDDGETASQDGKKTQWKVGDPVLGLLYGGGYAEYVTVNKRMLIAKPPELSWEQCGGLCEVWFTALQALHIVGRYSPLRTRSILWHAGASAVSAAGIQLSHQAHLFHGSSSTSDSPSSVSAPKVFATARRADKCAFCITELGCAAAVDLSCYPDKRAWANEVRTLNSGRDVDLVIDFLGGPYLQGNLDILAVDGAVVQLGLLDGPIASGDTNIAAFVMKRARLEGSTLRTRSVEYQISVRDLFVERVLPGLVDGRFRHIVDHVRSWERIREAHELLERNETKGKIVCIVD